tara:strand:- start:162 stop:341 length:180 start_codon:yes stop_codon:yes gene_type:complete
MKTQYKSLRINYEARVELEFDSILFGEDIKTASPYSMMLMKDKSYEYIHGNDTITLHKF